MRLTILVILLSLNTDSFGQVDSALVNRINVLRELFENTKYEQLEFKDTSLALLRKISKEKKGNQYPSRSNYLNSRAEQLNKDIGLDFAGSFIENFNLDPVQDIEENISYRRRVQVGMQWDVLDGGLLENKVRAQMMRDQAHRVELLNTFDRENHDYLERFDLTIFVFNYFKIKLLEKRANVLRKEQSILRELVYLKRIPKEELIKIDIKLSEVQNLMSIYESYNQYLGYDINLSQYTLNSFPLIDLNYEAVFHRIGIQPDSLQTQSDYVAYLKWYHQIGLRPFVRYNYYDMAASFDRSYFSAGLNFTVPLNFDTELNNQVEQERWEYENDRLVYQQNKVTEDIMNSAYDFRHQMKQFMDRYQRRKLTNERLRVERTKLRLSQSSLDPINGLALNDELYEADIDLFESLQSLYLKALKIQSKIPGTSIDQIIKRKTLNENYSYTTTPKRSVYIWSKTFEDYPSDFLAEYAVYNEFEKVIVAASDVSNSRQKDAFFQYALQNSAVYFMLGNNKLFYNKDIKSYLSKVLDNHKTIAPNGIHLDIEPHTFEDWPENRDELLKGYLNLVKEVKSFCDTNNLKLEISVPKHYDPDIMQQLYEIVDKVYFMCYENVDTDFLVRKLRPYADQYPSKTVIALRTEDFADRLSMENKVEDLQRELGLGEFAYHDLQRLIRFDKQGNE